MDEGRPNDAEGDAEEVAGTADACGGGCCWVESLKEDDSVRGRGVFVTDP